MTENKAIIAICAGHTQAEKAIADLQQLGFTRTHLSVFGKAYASDGDVVGCYTSGGHLKARGGSLAFWDRLWNLLGDGGFFLVPNVGPVAIAGSFVRALVTTIDEGVAIGGLSALGAAIYCLGIPRDSILRYEIELRASECALLAVGSPELVAKAKTSLKKAGVSEITTTVGCRLGNADKVLQMTH